MRASATTETAARAYAYIVRDGQVAVFDHPDPDAGVQVPGGGVETGETSEEAVVREAREESGLDCEVVTRLGVTQRQAWFPDGDIISITRHYFHLRPLGPAEERWTWIERHSSDGSGPLEFAFRWLPVVEAAETLDFGFGEMLSALGPSGADGGAAPDGPASVVAAGYDRLAARYPEWSRSSGAQNVRHALIDRATAVGATGPALDIGCGTGELATARLAERGFDVVGVDLSPVSVARAKAAIPGGVFLAANIADLSLPLRHFGLVTAFNSVIHIPRRRHAALFRDVRRWLRPGGVFVLNVETDGKSGEGTAEAWLDEVEMYWSGWTAAQEIGLLERAGLHVLETAEHESGGARFTWLVCCRPE